MIVASILSAGLAIGLAEAQDEPLSVGQRIEVRGALDQDGRFVADKVELREAEAELLVGTVPDDQVDASRFTLLGQSVEVGEETRWKKLEPGSMAGKRLRVQGRWEGPHRFVAHKISLRDEGRDRIGGRIDELVRVEGGWRARVMIFDVFLAEGVGVEQKSDEPAFRGDETQRDEDDTFGKGIRLAEGLRLSGQITGRSDVEENFDLDDTTDADRKNHEIDLRARLTWVPSDAFVAVSELRTAQLWRDDQVDGHSSLNETQLGEAWVLWRAGGTGLQVAIGRQDFDDPREWIYDQNLDALRVAWVRPHWRLDLSASTTFTDGDERDEASANYIAYMSNNNQKKHLALWSVYRDIDNFVPTSDLSPAERTSHIGVTALGRWIPQNKSWFEFAYLLGERDDRDVRAWGGDAGTTWSPPALRPFYFTVGYAFGTGEDARGTVDGNFRQTGFQDNTARFGGVTTFRYYGELLDPELSNLHIITGGVGAIVAKRTSLDLVYHDYRQEEADGEFSPGPNVEANVDQEPNGMEDDLGSELDLIFGFRRFASWDIEFIGAWFNPGRAFDMRDDAYLAFIQLRYRF